MGLSAHHYKRFNVSCIKWNQETIFPNGLKFDFLNSADLPQYVALGEKNISAKCTNVNVFSFSKMSSKYIKVMNNAL